MLPFYATIFDSVELNNSFYQIPKEHNVKTWKEITPQGFIFSCKANRYITHMRKLRDTQESVERLLKAFSLFEEKLGPVLFQFPPYWPVDLSLFSDFIDKLPQDFRYTFEFRHISWFCEELYALLQQKNMALCFYDFKTFQPPEIIVADFIYIRMHGPKKIPYQGSYDEETLNTYAAKILRWQKENKNVYCYFDNDEKACAPHDAQRLQQKIESL